MNIRVLSYNIHKGYSTLNRKFVLNEVKEALRELDPDIVFLQEISGQDLSDEARLDGWPDNNQFEFLADEVWPHHAYGRNAVSDARHYGNAILSRFPILEYENINITVQSMQKRGLLHARIDVPLSRTQKTTKASATKKTASDKRTEIHLLNVHLDLFAATRVQQVEKIIARIEDEIGEKTPLILAGDFNDWNTALSPVFEKSLGLNEAHLFHEGNHAKTFPSIRPTLSLDRIYFRKLKVHSAKAVTGPPWNRLSDHIAIMAEFTL
jgi:endonuclease/exonuclease/phosphatase family metal-dependent hydrolase